MRKLHLAMILFVAVFAMFSCGNSDDAQNNNNNNGGNGVVPSGDFTDNGNGTVTDKDTGLIWQQTDDGTQRNWSDAATYCQNLSLAGLTDWFLPSRDQLKDLVYTEYDPTIDPLFHSTKASHYWTSTENQICCAWTVNFSDGSLSNGFFRTDLYYVRCAHQP